jgi:hypothetical protein
MQWDRRKNTNLPLEKHTPLPADYTKLVTETVTTALTKGLNEIKKTHPKIAFTANGGIYADEVFLAITLSQGDQDLSATTVYASSDFNPNAEMPTLEMVLAACLDAAGSVFDFYLNPANPERREQLLHTTLAAVEEAPFEWTRVELNDIIRYPAWVRMDKLNPALEALASEWLSKHDPDYDQEAEQFLEERIEAIKAAKDGSGSSSGPIRH